MPETQSMETAFVATALKSWDLWVSRTGKLFDSLTEEQMFTEIAPGKNRPVYLLGHLIAVHDAMLPQMGVGQASYEHLRETFLSKPDGAVDALPTLAELRQTWVDLHARLDAAFKALTPTEWLEKHALVSEEDFVKDPLRNRYSILQSRTAHAAYHLGQLVLFVKRP